MNEAMDGFVPFEDGSLFRSITPNGYVEGPCMLKRGGVYHFMWSQGGWTNGTYHVCTSASASPLEINPQGKTVEMNYTFMGNTYTSRYDPRSGQFIANTYGDKNGMQFANGTTYTPSKASSVWENLNTALPIIKDCLTWAAQFVPDVLGKFIPITTANTVPQQSDYYVESGSPKTATFGVISALLIGGLLLSGGIKPKKKG